MLLLLDAAREGSPEGALQLLMRWSGVFICDGDTLQRGDAHASGEQVLRSAKSGELVTVQLPHLVLKALAALPERDGPSYFWSGKSPHQTRPQCLPNLPSWLALARRVTCARDLQRAPVSAPGLARQGFLRSRAEGREQLEVSCRAWRPQHPALSRPCSSCEPLWPCPKRRTSDEEASTLLCCKRWLLAVGAAERRRDIRMLVLDTLLTLAEYALTLAGQGWPAVWPLIVVWWFRQPAGAG